MSATSRPARSEAAPAETTTGHSHRGLSLSTLGSIGYVFVMASVAGMIWVNLRVGDPRAASLSDLSAALLFEVLSWAGLPILTWCFVHQYRAHEGSWSMLGWLVAAAVVAEVPYDLAVSNRALDFSSQNLLWAYVICFLCAKALEQAQSGAWKAVAIMGGLLWLVLLSVGVRYGLVYLGLVVFAFFLVFWFLANRENTMMMTAGLLGASMLVAPAFGVIFLHYRRVDIDDDRRPHRLLVWGYPVLMAVAALSVLG